MVSLVGNVFLLGKIEVVTGLHIGAAGGKAEIGAVDSPVLRDPHSQLPYLPGSSLKGKMRALSEFAQGLVGPEGHVHGGPKDPCENAQCPVCLVFGRPGNTSLTVGQARLLVRDAWPDAETQADWENIESDLLYTEYKGENFLNRLTSAATPRFFERVVPGSWFNFEMVYSVFNFDGVDDIDAIDTVFRAMRLLEHSSLGGHGSRGYGKIRFHLLLRDGALPYVFTAEDYKNGSVNVPDVDKVPRKELVTLEKVKVDAVKKALRDILYS